MSKIKKLGNLVDETQADIDRSVYLSASALSQHAVLTQFIIEFLNDVEVDKETLALVEKIIKIYKTIYDVNWTRSHFLFNTITDERYDAILEKYKAITGEEPFQSHIPSGMRSMEHDFPELVGTLDKAYEIQDVSDKMSMEKYLQRIMKDQRVKTLSLGVMLKYDGSSVVATYEPMVVSKYNAELTGHTIEVSGYDSYKPVSATSRGDFQNNLGVDMSPIIGACPVLVEGVTDMIEQFRPPNQLGIQFEAIVTEEGRIALSVATGVTYETRRAATSAAIKRIATTTSRSEREAILKCISMIPIGVNADLLEGRDWFTIMTSLHKYATPKEFGFGIRKIQGNLTELLDQLQEIVIEMTEKRSTLPYSIDGLVITVLDRNIQRSLGRANNKNRWQIAYKFSAIVQRTIVRGILTTQGRQGYMGHNILFDPIEFNGVKYDKAPVNNIDRFEGLDLRVGDEVLVSYNADVMGYIYKDDTCIPNKDGKRIKLPTTCINCDHELVEKKNMLLCVNDDCPGHAIGHILEAVRILNLDHFGEETAAGLAKTGIRDVIDFITMTQDQLAKVLVGRNLEKAWDELQQKLQASIDYARVFDLLRIPGLRTKTAEKIIDHLGIDRILNHLEHSNIGELWSDISSVPGIDKTAEGFATALVTNRHILYKLLDSLNVVKADVVVYDKTVLVSGFRSNAEVESICKRLNYKMIESGRYDILVVTPDRMDGTKAKAARKSGKPIYTVTEFINNYAE